MKDAQVISQNGKIFLNTKPAQPPVKLPVTESDTFRKYSLGAAPETSHGTDSETKTIKGADNAEKTDSDRGTVSEKEKAAETDSYNQTVTSKEPEQEWAADSDCNEQNADEANAAGKVKEIVPEPAAAEVSLNSNCNSNNNVFSGSVSLNRSGIINLGRPTPYRGDCQMGKFKIKTNPVSDTLDFTVLAIRHLQGEFFNYEYQDWIEIIFIDEKKIVSAMLLKTESMDNFGLTTKFILSSGKRLIDVIITGCFVKKTSVINKSSYYALEFRFRDNDPETVKEIETFMDQCDVTKITGLNF